MSSIGKLIVLSLDESEKGIYDQIMKIVNEADIRIDRKLDKSQRDIQVGGLNIMPGQGNQSDQYWIPYPVCASILSGHNAF